MTRGLLEPKDFDVISRVIRLFRFLPDLNKSSLLLSLLKLPPVFKINRDFVHLSRMISAEFYILAKIKREILHSPNKRHLLIKFIPGQLIFPFGKKRVLGVVLVFNLLREHESLQKERILENFRKFSGPVEDVEGSFLEFLDRQNKICSIYLELENIHLEPFREILQEEIKECVTELIPKTFMRRNEEEIYKSIQVLRNQLNSVQDIPQAIINFEEQTLKDLFFTVVLLRIVKRPGSASVHELLNKATDEFIYIEDRNILVGTLEEKYEKEAAIFRIQIQKAPYFRKNGSLNLYRARMKVLSILTAAFGEIRDYNGGLMQEQNKQFEAFVESVQRDFDEFLHENFFYSINPIEMQSTLPTVLVREWFELFSQLFCLKTSQNENFWVASSAKQNIHMFAVRLEENAIKERILNEMVALSMPERNFASTEIYRKGEYYFGCLIRKNGLPDFQQRLPDIVKQSIDHLKKGQHMRLILQDVGSYLDPRIATGDQSYIIIKMLFEGLTRIGQDGRPTLALAESYETTADFIKYVFTLRASKWSDGTPITAHDFEYSWKKALDQSQVSSPFLAPLFLIKNARARKEKTFGGQIGVCALDERTLSVELEYPAPHFLEVVAHGAYLLINSSLDRRRPDWAYSEGEGYVCNGPFKLIQREPILVVEKNPYYWDRERVNLNRISIFKLDKSQSPVEMLTEGKLDIIGRPMIFFPPEGLETSEKKGIEKISYSLQGVFSLCFNLNRPPFNNQKIRSAFAYAVDREEVVSISRHEFSSARYTLLPSALSLHEQPLFPGHDLERAKSLFLEGLSELGLRVENFPVMKICYCSNRNRTSLFQMLQKKWSALFGIRIILSASPWESHFQKLTEGEFDLGAIELNALWSDPFHFFEFFENKNDPLNICSWEAPAYKDLLQEARTTHTFELRSRLLKKAEQLLAQQVPAIPLYQLKGIYLKRRDVADVLTSGYFLIDFKQASRIN